MKEQVEKRLEALKAEFEQGERMLAELRTREAQLRETMLRIAGAIQVLEEITGAPAENGASANGAASPNGAAASAPALESAEV